MVRETKRTVVSSRANGTDDGDALIACEPSAPARLFDEGLAEARVLRRALGGGAQARNATVDVHLANHGFIGFDGQLVPIAFDGIAMRFSAYVHPEHCGIILIRCE